MKSQPESAPQNTDPQQFDQTDLCSVPNPLENLYSLLKELVEEDHQQSEPVSKSEILSNERKESEPVSKSEILSNDQKIIDRVSETASTSASIELDSQNKSLEDKLEKLQNVFETEIIEQASSKAETKTELKAEAQNKKPKNQEKLESLVNDNSVNQTDSGRISVSQEWITEKERQINQLAASINALIPLIVELSNSQDDSSQEYILKAIVPIIDRVIQQRSVEDNQKMAAAIANILPDAIRQEITNAPQAIGKAIAPELALSITEQIKLDQNAIAQALGSEMGKAIKTQIEMERDAMVDALYPVIGSTISKYMAEVVQSINQKVDRVLSIEGFVRKIRAQIKGVSEAELIFKESFPYSIRAIFLIHKTSGLIIGELQPNSEFTLESDLLAGMLTAIRSFANDCIASNSELDEIAYDKFQILFETAGYCYLAVVINGEPDRQFRDRMRAIFSKIIMKYGNVIEQYQGNPATIPESLQPLLEELTIQQYKQNAAQPPRALYGLIALLLGSLLIPWGIVKYRGYVANQIEKAVAVELDATPELSVYRLSSEVKKGTLAISGRVPSLYLRNLAAKVTNQIAIAENLALDNQIVAVNVPVDPAKTTQDVARITNLLNQNSQVLINTDYQNKTVTIEGLILDETERQKLLATFTSIPGVEKVVFLIQQQLPSLETRVYFPSGSTEFNLAADSVKINEIKQFLIKYPLIKLRIIGHSDRRGTRETNLQLAKTRANLIYQTLIAQGIEPKRLEVIATLEPPPNLSSDQPLWLSRCVRFESFITENN